MNKTVLITGASSGIGYEFVKLFSKDNYHLILVARNLKRLNEIKNEFPNTNITIVSKDLTKTNGVKELYDEIKLQKFNVDILVNNAGFGLLGEFDKLDLNKQLNMIQLNISVLTELTFYVLQEMKSRKYGKILNVASVASFEPGPLMAVYYATKAYVLSFSEALVQELKETGITVTTLCPGPTATNFGKVASADKTKIFSKTMAADVVTKIGYNGLMKNKRVVIPGATNKAMVYLVKFLPRSLVTKVVMFISKQ